MIALYSYRYRYEYILAINNLKIKFKTDQKSTDNKEVDTLNPLNPWKLRFSIYQKIALKDHRLGEYIPEHIFNKINFFRIYKKYTVKDNPPFKTGQNSWTGISQ